MNPQGTFPLSAGLVESAAGPWGHTDPPLSCSRVAAPTILGTRPPKKRAYRAPGVGRQGDGRALRPFPRIRFSSLPVNCRTGRLPHAEG